MLSMQRKFETIEELESFHEKVMEGVGRSGVVLSGPLDLHRHGALSAVPGVCQPRTVVLPHCCLLTRCGSPGSVC